MFAEYARSVWDGVVGQPRAVEQLTRAAAAPVHAYLFVGPPGSTKHEAARAFAALLLTGHDDPDARDARSEERRVGKECRRLCRSRWSPYH
jgi:DNA polymerase-3 subunit delta'